MLAESSRRFVRFTELPPTSYVTVAGVTAFAFASVVWFMDGLDDYARSVSWDWTHDFARSAASLLTALFFMAAAARHLKRVRSGTEPAAERSCRDT